MGHTLQPKIQKVYKNIPAHVCNTKHNKYFYLLEKTVLHTFNRMLYHCLIYEKECDVVIALNF